MTRVSLAEVLLSVGDRGAARELLVTADRWYAEYGAGEGAAMAACLLAIMRAEDGDPDAPEELRTIHETAVAAGDRRVAALSLDASARHQPDTLASLQPDSSRGTTSRK